MPSLSDISARIGSHNPQLYSRLQFSHLAVFFDTVSRLHPAITLNAPRSSDGKLPVLPASVREVIASQVGLPFLDVNALWESLGDLSLSLSPNDLPDREQLDRSITLTAPGHSLGICLVLIVLYPLLQLRPVLLPGAQVVVTPHATCITINCPERSKPLSHAKSYSAVLFSRTRGVLPLQVIRLYCRSEYNSCSLYHFRLTL